MKTRSLLLAAFFLGLALVLALAAGAGASPGIIHQDPPGNAPDELAPNETIGTKFTYQGRLKQNGNPANGYFDFKFTLYDSETGVTPAFDPLEREDVNVRNGMFTVVLDFGNVFTGDILWLEVGVRPAGGTGSYVALDPRHPTYAKPYAIFSRNSAMLGGHFTAYFQARVDGTCPEGQAIQSVNADGSVSCESLTGAFWALNGNAGTSAANFLGTTDNMTLIVKVNNIIGWRLAPGGSNVPNVLGGASTNEISSGVYGATIAGGGSTSAGYENSVTGNHGTVAGGWANLAASKASVGGGYYNRAEGDDATIGGGVGNEVTSQYGTIGGGDANEISATGATIPGGMYASATHFGELAYSAGTFAANAPGSSQTSTYVLMELTGGASPESLSLGGGGSKITIAEDRSVAFDILVVGHSTVGLSAGYQIKGLIENHNGTVAFVGSPVVTVLGEDNAAWDANVRILSGALDVYVTGTAEDNIYWTAAVRTAEVQIP